jgi:hypothetical protein
MAFLFRIGARAAVVAGGSGIAYLSYLSSRFGQIFNEVSDLGVRVDKAEGRLEELDGRLRTVEEKTHKVDQLEVKIDEYQAQTWSEIELIKRKINMPVTHGHAMAANERIRQATGQSMAIPIVPNEHSGVGHNMMDHHLHFGGVETKEKDIPPLHTAHSTPSGHSDESSKKRGKSPSPLINKKPPVIQDSPMELHTKQEHLVVPTITVSQVQKDKSDTNPIGSLFGAVGGFAKGAFNSISTNFSDAPKEKPSSDTRK